MVSPHRIPSTIARLKNAAYTGENRCTPCTAVNVVFALVLAVVVGSITGSGSIRGAIVATAVFGGSLGVIYFRGYLVPGTPRLTKRYLPERVLAAFDKVETPAEGLVDPESELRRIGIVTVDPRIDDLVCTPAFDDAWTEAIDTQTVTDADIRTGLADTMDLDPDRLEIVDRSPTFVYHDGALVARWESRAACRADVAAATLLPRFDPGWYRRPVADRLDLLASLRFFLENCPTCAGDVSLSHDVVESCCRSHDVVAMTCNDCTARLVEMPIDAEALELADSTRTETA